MQVSDLVLDSVEQTFQCSCVTTLKETSAATITVAVTERTERHISLLKHWI